MDNTAEQDTNEEILLASDEPTEPSKPNLGDNQKHTVSVKFTQINPQSLQGNKLCIYDNQYLEIKQYQYKKKLQYWLNLNYVNTEPQRLWIINWNWAWLALTLTGLVLLVGLTPIVEFVTENQDYIIPAIVALTTFNLLSIIMLVRGARHVVRFTSQNGNITLFELFVNRPNKIDFLKFLRQLNDCGNLAKSNNSLDPTQNLAAEMAEHRRLREENVITAEDYELAKANLLSLHRN